MVKQELHVRAAPGQMQVLLPAADVQQLFAAQVILVQMVLNLIAQLLQVVQHVLVPLLVRNAQLLTTYQTANVHLVRVMQVVQAVLLGAATAATTKTVHLVQHVQVP